MPQLKAIRCNFLDECYFSGVSQCDKLLVIRNALPVLKILWYSKDSEIDARRMTKGVTMCQVRCGLFGRMIVPQFFIAEHGIESPRGCVKIDLSQSFSGPKYVYGLHVDSFND